MCLPFSKVVSGCQLCSRIVYLILFGTFFVSLAKTRDRSIDCFEWVSIWQTQIFFISPCICFILKFLSKWKASSDERIKFSFDEADLLIKLADPFFVFSSLFLFINFLTPGSVTRFGDILDFGQLFKAFGNN